MCIASFDLPRLRPYSVKESKHVYKFRITLLSVLAAACTVSTK